ncbi:MAG: hypothetical protein GYA62_02870 [Bacteroidales bacterium]|jgi:hypothetical protein|nr:hypothetical protein [Bacteroidales bacterium]
MRPNTKKVTIILFTALFVVGILLYRFYPDKHLFTLSSLEKDAMLKRDGYLRIGAIGQIYGRKIGNYYFNRYLVYSLKLVQKISIPLDPIKYFNSTNQSMIPYILFPFFILGMLYVVEKHLLGLYGYLLISAFFTCLIVPDKTLYLYFPLIIFSILAGMAMFYRYIRRHKK